jgi:fermentation-respiration switch protein FrsA (DUF1100 family)
LGHSLGGAVALNALAAGHTGVRSAVIQASFTRYRSMARHVLKQSAFTWPLYPFYPLFLGTRWDAERAVKKIKGLPLFFIHGDKDTIIPLMMSEKLFKAAGEPKKLWIVKGAGHNNLRTLGGKDYEKKVADFFDASAMK